jgi:hypothetical protein
MCCPALALRRPWPRGAVTSRELHGACPTRADGDALVAEHACAARRWPFSGCGRGGRSRRASCAGRAGPPQRRHANGSTHMCGPAPVLRRPWLGRAVASRKPHGACRSRSNGDAPMATHTCAALRWHSAGCGRGGRSRRASRTGRAGLAAMATCRWRHTHVLPGAGPLPAVTGEGGRAARAARGVQVSQRSRRADGGKHMCGPAQALRWPWPGRAVAPREPHGACRSRSDGNAPMVAHTCAPGAGPPPAVAGKGGRVARAARGVQVSPRSRRAGGCIQKCSPALALRPPWAGRAVTLR